MGGSVPANDLFAEVFLTLLAISLVVFVLPIVIAFWRRHPNRWPILIITVVFGATLFGWLVALIWALNWDDLGDRGRTEDDDYELGEFDDDDDRWDDEDRPLARAVERVTDARPGTDPGDNGLGVHGAAEQIERLARLRAQNHIDGHEYQALKAAVLDRLRSSSGR